MKPITTTATPPVMLYLLALSNQPPSHEAMSWLSASERQQAASFSREPSRHRYLQVRAAVRYCLAHYTGSAPQHLIITRSDAGKPELAPPWQSVFFSISHSDDQLAIAITTAGAVGVDLEKIAARRPCMAIAERYFHPHETHALHHYADAEQTALFFNFWTLKEAFFKATGSGIAAGLDKAQFTLTGATIRPQFDSALQEDEAHWQFRLWTSAAGYKMSLALRHPAAPATAIPVQLQPLQLEAITGQQKQAATFCETAAT